MVYSYMVTLLLCFFILLLSFTDMDAVKFKQALGSMRQALGVQQQAIEPAAQAGMKVTQEPAQPDPGMERQKKRLIDALRMELKKQGLEDHILVVPGRGGARLEITEAAVGGMFAPGTAAMQPGLTALLRKLVPFMKETVYRITIEVHTGNAPLESSVYPSNWELSGARAGSAARFLIREGQLDPRRFTASGHSGSRPLAETDISKNRRISIIYQLF
jgi:chemotaxis protein MotB